MSQPITAENPAVLYQAGGLLQAATDIAEGKLEETLGLVDRGNRPMCKMFVL